ncbi:J domain-containing protein [Iocasia frigidifontis]|nr:DnaJ domain-containing protein [Iocasia fonsfrigidae]
MIKGGGVSIKRNYYEVLGVSPDVGMKELKKVYRKLTLKYHPDRNIADEDAEEKFRLIVEAYNTLSSEKKRKEYDAVLRKQSSRENKRNVRERGFEKPRPEEFEKKFQDFFGFNPRTKEKIKVKNKKDKGSMNTNDLFMNYFGGKKN